MTAAPFSMVAIKMSWPGQSTNDTCLENKIWKTIKKTNRTIKKKHGCQKEVKTQEQLSPVFNWSHMDKSKQRILNIKVTKKLIRI